MFHLLLQTQVQVSSCQKDAHMNLIKLKTTLFMLCVSFSLFWCLEYPIKFSLLLFYRQVKIPLIQRARLLGFTLCDESISSSLL